MSSSIQDIQLLLINTPSSHWIDFKQLSTLLSNSTIIKDNFRLEYLTWRLWSHAQQTTKDINNNNNLKEMLNNKKQENIKECSSYYKSKFFFELDYDDSSIDDDSSIEETELIFDKKENLPLNNSISLLSQKLNKPQPEPLLKRCQSKYQHLDEWFATTL